MFEQPLDLAQRVAEQVNSSRLQSRLLALAEIGGRSDGGVSRETLTELDLQARRYLCDWAISLGCKVYQDDCANLFFRLEGQEASPAILTGSHIDTQPIGGKYDGAYGVVAGLELIEAFRAAGQTPLHPIEVVSWTNEEGSRFAPGAMGSSAYADPSRLKQYLSTQDAAGISFANAVQQAHTHLADIPKRPLGGCPSAYLELHIEQGPVLERAACDLGIVNSIQSVRWFQISCIGRMGHAGTTPMNERQDAMATAISLAAEIQSHAAPAIADGLRLTIGRWQASPNSVNTIAGRVDFTLDMRAVDERLLDEFERTLRQIIKHTDQAARIEMTCLFQRGTTLFAPALLQQVRQACIKTCLDLQRTPPREMTSGAFHDAMYLAEICPSAMLFVPSHEGISHNAAEFTEPEQLYIGARALALAVAQLAYGQN